MPKLLIVAILAALFFCYRLQNTRGMKGEEWKLTVLLIIAILAALTVALSAVPALSGAWH